MAINVGPSIDRINNMEAIGLPLGKWLLFGVGLGVSSAVISTAQGFGVKPYLSGPGFALLLKKFPAIRGLLGNTMTEILAITAGTTALEETFGIQAKTKGGIRKIVSYVSPGAAAQIQGGSVRALRGVNTPRREVPARPGGGRLGSIPRTSGYSQVEKRLSVIPPSL
jgi:hypothetical protein